jgi:SAM-dependent methyltransferase
MIRQVKRVISKLIRVARYYLSAKKYFCPVCKTKVRRFKPISEDYLATLDKHQYIFSIFSAETFNLLHYTCPNCYASDRYRLYALYIDRALDGTEERLKFIDFAPDKAFSRFLKKYENLEYRSADLYMENVDDKVDITNMPLYPDNSVDIFLCSHMLEHINDDKKAVSELYRIMKPGGWGIVMAPIVLTLKETFEDPAVLSEADRWHFFGQDDHVRLYSKQGFISLLQGAGFSVNQLGAAHFGKDTFLSCGINERSVLYIAKKESNHPND